MNKMVEGNCRKCGRLAFLSHVLGDYGQNSTELWCMDCIEEAIDRRDRERREEEEADEVLRDTMADRKFHMLRDEGKLRWPKS